MHDIKVNVLHAAGLAGRRTLTMDAAGEGEAVLVEVSTADMLHAWKSARAAVPKTGRWPLLITSFGSSKDWKAEMEDSNPFSRWWFGEDEGKTDVRPSDVLDRAAHIDIDAEFDGISDPRIALTEGRLKLERDRTLFHCGDAPAMEELAAVGQEGPMALERYLFDWELAHGCEPPLQYQDWFVPNGAIALALLPIAEPWSVYSYINSLYLTDHGLLVAASRRWNERYGAEPVASWSTMTQLSVSRRPSGRDEAFRLALEQAFLAPDTLGRPGIAFRWHARALMELNRWFLHSRP